MSKRVWLQNEYMERVAYWAGRGELAEHIFRKGYQRRCYDVEVVEIGMPKPTEQYTVMDLLARGIVGMYSYRQDESEGAWPLIPP